MFSLYPQADWHLFRSQARLSTQEVARIAMLVPETTFRMAPLLASHPLATNLRHLSYAAAMSCIASLHLLLGSANGWLAQLLLL